MFSNGVTAMTGVFIMASSWLEYLVLLIEATRSNLIRSGLLVLISGPSSVLSLSGHLLIIMSRLLV